MLALLRQPKLCRFFTAHGQSQLGTGAGYVALVLIAYQRLHSGWAVVLVLLADFLPGIALAAYFGVVADRCSRRRLAIAAELIRAGAFIALALTASFGATIALALLAGVGAALFRPAVSAALPTLVSAEERSRATALYGALQSAGMTLGPALCGSLLLIGPVTWVLCANGASFLVSAVLLAGVPLGTGTAIADHDGDPTHSAWASARDGVRCATHEHGVAPLLVIGAASVLCGALINVAEPLLATGPLHAGNSGFSILISLYGAGMVAGSIYTARLGSSIRVLRANFLVGVAATGVAMLTCALAGSLLAALAPFAMIGFANAVIIGPENRLLQELVSGRLRGRVFGLSDTLDCTCFATAFIAAGCLLSVVGPRTVYVLSGAMLIGTAAVGSRLFTLRESTQRASEHVLRDPVPAADLA